MTASQLDITLRVLYDGHKGHNLSGHMAQGGPGAKRFVTRYTDFQSGWLIAKEFALRGRNFPLILTGSDRWIFRAYLHCMGRYDDVVAEAHALANEPRLQHIADTLRAALVAPGATVSQIEKHTGMHPDVIIAFEKLFFGIFDRIGDRTYVKDMTYPIGRMVEMMDNYAESESFGKMLLRIGFSKGLEVAMYVAGITSGGILKDGDTSDRLAEQLESMILANGLLAAHSGLSHQSRHAIAIQHAKTLLAAAKQGGHDTGNQSPISTLDKKDPLLGQMHVFLDMDRRQRAAKKAARMQLLEVGGSAEYE